MSYLSVVRPQRLFAIVMSVVLVSGTAEACTESEALLRTEVVSDALKGKPCDSLGALYLDGLSASRMPSVRSALRLDDRFLFYAFTRVFLHRLAGLPTANAEFEGFDDAYANLIAAVFLARNQEGLGDVRVRAYSAYAKLAFAQYGRLGKTSQEALIEAFRMEISEEFASGREVFCFVRHDIPVFDEEHILASPAYRGCLSER